MLQAVAGVLGRQPDNLSIDDNFFDLGGHSLSATRLVTRLQKVLQVCGAALTLSKRTVAWCEHASLLACELC